MKKPHQIIILFLFLSLDISVHAQKLSFYPADSVVEGGNVVCASNYDTYIYFENISGADIDSLKWTLLDIDTPIGWKAGICCTGRDGFLECKDPIPDSLLISSLYKDSTDYIKVTFFPNGIYGCGVVNIYLFDVADPLNGDTLKFKYCCAYPALIDELEYVRLNIYPNPISNSTILELQKSESYTIAVFDVLGNMVGKEEVKFGSFFLNSEEYKSGLYFIKAWSDREKFVGRFVVN